MSTSLEKLPQEEGAITKVREVLALYTRDVVSFARAAELAGLSRQEMIRWARALGIHPRSSEQMFKAELEQVVL